MKKRFKPMTVLVMVHVAILIVVLGLLIKRKGAPPAGKDQILVIPVEGMISLDQGALGRGMSVDAIVRTLKDAAEDDDVKAVVFRINSPGGSVAAVQEIHRAILYFKSKGKPVVSSFGEVSASGGYYIACAGDKIVANPGTITGSIGVIAQFPNVEGLLQKVGVSMNTIKSGAMKDVGSPFRRLSEEERRYIKDLIMDSYAQFFAAVKDGRKMDEATLKPLADGRIFTGTLAMKHKLVDSLGGMEEAINIAKSLANITEEKPTIIYKKGKKSLDQLLDIMGRTPLDRFSSSSVRPGLQLLYLME